MDFIIVLLILMLPLIVILYSFIEAIKSSIKEAKTDYKEIYLPSELIIALDGRPPEGYTTPRGYIHR